MYVYRERYSVGVCVCESLFTALTTYLSHVDCRTTQSFNFLQCKKEGCVRNKICEGTPLSAQSAQYMLSPDYKDLQLNNK